MTLLQKMSAECRFLGILMLRYPGSQLPPSLPNIYRAAIITLDPVNAAFFLEKRNRIFQHGKKVVDIVESVKSSFKLAIPHDTVLQKKSVCLLFCLAILSLFQASTHHKRSIMLNLC